MKNVHGRGFLLRCDKKCLIFNALEEDRMRPSRMLCVAFLIILYFIIQSYPFEAIVGDLWPSKNEWRIGE